MMLTLSFFTEISGANLDNSSIFVKEKINGNYELECVVDVAPSGFCFFFSADKELSEYGFLKVSSSSIADSNNSELDD